MNEGEMSMRCVRRVEKRKEERGRVAGEGNENGVCAAVDLNSARARREREGVNIIARYTKNK